MFSDIFSENCDARCSILPANNTHVHGGRTPGAPRFSTTDSEEGAVLAGLFQISRVFPSLSGCFLKLLSQPQKPENTFA